jgi:membrane protein implicated in regulation of membrane protease activity
MKNERNIDNGMFVYAVLALVIAVMWVVLFNNIALGIIFTAISAVTMFFAVLQKKQVDNKFKNRYEK